jgi:hypothetical protein
MKESEQERERARERGCSSNNTYLVGSVGTEQPTSTTRTDLPTLNVLRIGPHQIAESALMRNLLVTVDGADLIERLDIGRKTTMDAKDLTINQLQSQHKWLGKGTRRTLPWQQW